MSYLDLGVEKVRFQGQLDVTMDIKPGAENVLIPDLVLQPLVENALKYGRMTSPDILRLKIEVDRRHDRLQISMRNSGQLIETREGSTGLGLANLRERLGLVYGADFSFALTQKGDCVRAGLDLPASIPPV